MGDIYARSANYSTIKSAAKGEIIKRAGWVCCTELSMADIDAPVESVLAAHYVPAIKTILDNKHPWSFASKTAKLVPVPGDDNKGLYYVPADNVRIHAIGQESCCGNIEEHCWRFQEGHIKVCCGCASIYYNYFNDNISSWSLTCEDAVTALVYCLAKLSITFVHKDIHQNTAIQVSAMYRQFIDLAVYNDKSNTNAFTIKRQKNWGRRW